MGATAQVSTNGSQSRDRGVVTRRMTWEGVIPFPENPIYRGRLDQMRREQGGYNHKIVGSPALFDNGAGAFPDFPEDTLFIGDGNHRYALAIEDKALDEEFIALVFRGLPKAAMYGIRRGLNDRRTIKPSERFLSLAEESRSSVQHTIKNIVEGLGWRVTHERAVGGLTCTNELEWIYTRDRTALTRALQSYEAAFGVGIEQAQARVVKGLGAFWIKYPDADPDRLTKALKALTVTGLYRAGKNQSENLPFIKTVFDGIRYVVAQAYNRGQRGGRLVV